MKSNQQKNRSISTFLGNNNILLLVPNGLPSHTNKEDQHSLTDLGFVLAQQLQSYAVINNKYKKTLIDLTDMQAVKTRKKVTDTFLVHIKRFTDEILENDMAPLVLIVQVADTTLPQGKHILFGYGQGERGVPEKPHNPTISPSQISRYRVAIEDQGITTDLAPPGSIYCGHSPDHLNQLYRQKNYLEGFYNTNVSSILLTLAPELVREKGLAEHTAEKLWRAMQQFQQKMPLVRKVQLKSIETQKEEDLQYIFRIHNDAQYDELTRESYIDELAGSIEKNGLLHPLVLLRKNDGYYKILCGFRRFQAAKRIGRVWIEAKIFQERDFTTEDFFNISLAENTKRRNLNPVEIGNFLDTASDTMHLNNTMLAEKFGETLGIGAPGQKVSHTTIHKYRKVNQIRTRNESPEIINDVINEKLQFSIAAEILAPIKDPHDRDSLYLEIIKPLAPTRPQLQSILTLLKERETGLSKAIAHKDVQLLLTKAMDTPQKAATFIRLMQQKGTQSAVTNQKQFTKKITKIRQQYFGRHTSKKDFNLTPDSGTANGELTLNLRINQKNYHEMLDKVSRLLHQEDLFTE
ncbi:ParB/RepB/Spo0J family partition protein [Desulfogranum marinum]|uniref:ParB/RepB/Spo0J family partition protein n=1 Tax=Desulfogranum marinum TaxID=453220 RepID=UPI0029C79869|nr:ParB/RepB/Spo0J family partition protein [Desulfogranum marinum]